VAESFRSALADLRRSCVPFYGMGAGAFHPVKVRPSLSWALVHRPRRNRADGDGSRGPEQRKRERIARLLAGGAPPALGLVEGGELDASPPNQSPRQGLGGLTTFAAGKIEDFCSLVRQDRGIYAIWTVTLPPEVALQLDALPNGCQRLSDVLRRRFGEELRRSCAREAARTRALVPDHWAFVIEPQKTGRPHWHFVFRCKARRGRRWLLGKGRLDRLIRNAFRTVTGNDHRTAAAGNVQALRSDPGRYLSKYLRKTARSSSADLVLASGWSVNLVPLRWSGFSVSARKFVESYRFELPSVFVGWLSKQWPLLAGIGIIDARLWQPEADGAPSMVVGSWPGIGAARRCIAHLAELAEAAVPSGRTFGLT